MEEGTQQGFRMVVGGGGGGGGAGQRSGLFGHFPHSSRKEQELKLLLLDTSSIGIQGNINDGCVFSRYFPQSGKKK